MREIKFRAKRKDTGDWIYWSLLDGFSDPRSLIDPETVGQYIGFLDKNRKDIYFDDIIEFSFHDEAEKEDPISNYSGTALIIESMNGGAGILYDWDENMQDLVACNEGGVIEDIWPDESLWTFNVIGNRCDNPKLLKQ